MFNQDQPGTAAGDATGFFLGQLAHSTGGQVIAAESEADVRDAFERIAHELSRQYVLRCCPAKAKLDGTYRQIRVAVDGAARVARARGGYRAGARFAGKQGELGDGRHLRSRRSAPHCGPALSVAAPPPRSAR
jgi:hypothetical protein